MLRCFENVKVVLGPQLGLSVVRRCSYSCGVGPTISETSSVIFLKKVLCAAYREIRKYHRKNMIDDAATLMEGTQAMAFNEAGSPGIRAQLVERRTNTLVMCYVPDDSISPRSDPLWCARELLNTVLEEARR